MKKYLISTLTAAAAMAVPAFALDGEGTQSSPYSGTAPDLDLTSTAGWTAGSTIYINGIAPTSTSGNNRVYLKGSSTSTETIVANINIGANGFTLNDGYSGCTYIFSGDISGTGDWSFSNSSTASQAYVFTGSLANYSGNISIVGGSASYIHFGNGGQAATNTNVSGTGSITVNDPVVFNYSSLANDSGTAITIGNKSITSTEIEFAGAVSYNVSSALTGYNSSSTLTISTQGTTTVTGSISGFSSITVNSGSTLAVSGSVDISSPIANSGTVTINSSASFVLDNMGYTGDWSTGATYTLVTGTGTVTGYGSLDVSNVSYTVTDGSITSASFNYDGSGTLTVTVTGTEGTLSDGVHGSGSVYNPYFTTGGTSSSQTTVSFNVSNFTGAGTTVYLATDAHSLGNEYERIYWSGTFTAACDIVIGQAGVYLTDGSAGNQFTFTGAISGEGSLTVGYTTAHGGDVRQRYSFTGDLSEWNGNFTITTHNVDDYVAFGGTINLSDSFVSSVTGTAAVTNTSVSGNGAIAVDYGTVYYAYTAGAGGSTGETLTVTNSSIEAHTVTFAGSVNYDVSSNLIGYDPSDYDSAGDHNNSGAHNVSETSTLTISTTGTVTVRGSVSGFDSIVVSEGSGLTVAAGASVTLKSGGDLTVNSGATLTLNTSIAASEGTVSFAEGASLVLTDAFLASTINTLDTYDAVTIIAASVINYNGSELSEENIDEFASIVSTSDNYLLDNWSYSDGVLSASVTYLPEPSMFGLMFGLGAIGLVATRRRKRV